VDGDDGSCGIILEIPPETRDPQREREREIDLEKARNRDRRVRRGGGGVE